MRQQRSARELLVSEAGDFLNLPVDLSLCPAELFGLGSQPAKLALGRLDVPVAVDAQAPFGLVAPAVAGSEGHAAVCFTAPPPQQVAHVVGLDGAHLSLHQALLGVGFKALHAVEARRAVIERQTDGVEQGRFACTRVASNRKQARRAQRFNGEIDDLFAFERRQVTEYDFLYFHR